MSLEEPEFPETVRDLIRILKRCDPDAQVLVAIRDSGGDYDHLPVEVGDYDGEGQIVVISSAR